MNHRYLFLFFLAFTFIYIFLKISALFKNQRRGKKIISSLIVTALIFILLLGGQFILRSSPDSINELWLGTFIKVSLGFFGLLSTALFFWFLTDIFVFSKKIWNNKKNKTPTPSKIESTDLKRREFLKLGLLNSTSAVAVGSTAMNGLGFLQASSGPELVKVKIPLSGAQKKLTGLKIVQISDLHVGAQIRKEYVEKVIQLSMQAGAQIIAITGDLADGTPEILKKDLEPFSKLNAPLGVFYCTGNHEYYWGANDWIDFIKSQGFIPLINENKIISFNGASIMMAGVTDNTSESFIPEHVYDPIKAAESPIQCDFKILLAHRPESYKEALQSGYDLQLSGHTHAGQYFPFSLLIGLFHRYSQGLYKNNKLWIYVNRGTGFWGPMNRLGVPAEVTLIEFE